MIRILIVLALAGGLGFSLASWPLGWPFGAGPAGLGLLVVAGVAARGIWNRDSTSPPGSPERTLWVLMGSSAAIATHLLASLWRIGPEFELNTDAGHRLGIDSWSLVLGMGLAYAIARDPNPRSDERDAWIASRGTHWTSNTLASLVLLMAVVLAFEPTEEIRRLSRPAIAHVAILCVILAWLVGTLVQLYAYALDHAAAREPA
ncbi:MAG: hypothetical protein MPN21_15510 [Thermoanaerobaculia bacterium]|nr:hypothetical protein [Thermoanaerobaculia bacterium]